VSRQRLIDCLEEQGKKIGFDRPVREFPLLRLFKIVAITQGGRASVIATR
jgi:hypothetical protein